MHYRYHILCIICYIIDHKSFYIILYKSECTCIMINHHQSLNFGVPLVSDKPVGVLWFLLQRRIQTFCCLWWQNKGKSFREPTLMSTWKLRCSNYAMQCGKPNNKSSILDGLYLYNTFLVNLEIQYWVYRFTTLLQ